MLGRTPLGDEALDDAYDVIGGAGPATSVPRSVKDLVSRTDRPSSSPGGSYVL
jgi:hypothetical protein